LASTEAGLLRKDEIACEEGYKRVSTQPPAVQQSGFRVLDYFIGFIVGLIPPALIIIAVFFINSSIGAGLSIITIAGLILYVVEVIVSIASLLSDRTRFFGYGLLTTVVLIFVLIVGIFIVPLLLSFFHL
jgi:hypothetical protein